MLIDFYWPIVGGAEQHVRSLSSALKRRGHDVAVVTLRQSGLPEFEVDGGVRVYRISGTTQRLAALFSDTGRRFSAPFPDPESMVELRKVIREERPDIIHAHSWLIHSLLPLKRLCGARLVMTLHDYGLSCAKKTLMYNGEFCDGPEMLKCLRCASAHFGVAKGVPTTVALRLSQPPIRHEVDAFIAVSRAVARGNGLTGSTIFHEVIPNFIPDEWPQHLSANADLLESLPDTEFLLFVGALGAHKGIYVLLEAYDQLADAPPLVLIGTDWVDTPSTFPENVVVRRNWPHAAVMDAWLRSSIAIAPSVWPEPCATVIMEAMRASRPVVSTRIGGSTDLVDDGRTGLLVDPGCASSLRDALAELISDPQRARHMGEEGRHRVRQFQSSSVVPNIERMYWRLV
jgi:glycosyltransferase involved in cell wall biosynthesis